MRSSPGKTPMPSGKPGRKPDAAVHVLLSMIENAEAGGLTTAAQALAKIAPEQAVTELTRRLLSPDARLRRHSADALACFRKTARPAVPSLVKLLEDSDTRVRISGATALRDIAEEPDLVVPALMGRLHDPELSVRRMAAIALRSFGPRAKEAVPAIIRIIKENRDAFYREALIGALADIDKVAAKRVARPSKASR